MNVALLSFVFTIASGVTIGVLMTIALFTGFDEINHIIVVCIAGFFLAMPIAWIIEKKLVRIGVSKTNNVV